MPPFLPASRKYFQFEILEIPNIKLANLDNFGSQLEDFDFDQNMFTQNLVSIFGDFDMLE